MTTSHMVPGSGPTSSACLAEITLRPLQPEATSYSPADPNAPYMTGVLNTWGGSTRHYPPARLGDQCAGNEVVFGNTLAPLDDHTMDSPNELIRYSTAMVYMSVSNPSDDMQVLGIFRFRHIIYSSTQIQFFVGNQWVRDAVVDTPSTETTALLVDVPPARVPAHPSGTSPPPPESHINVSARVAGSPSNIVAFTGFEAFLL